ncbi:MAG: hypothetical protein A3K68_00825 [Euryarchaeota archaeon RBG_16_68_13]|nr:MAG: hypothetical protein A3K68_00825 [Euryarchaeota archaeon RBG_16_68_13]
MRLALALRLDADPEESWSQLPHRPRNLEGRQRSQSEAFMYLRPFALPMARFPEAEKRLLHKKICMRFLSHE